MKETLKIDPFGFREYDARWLYPENINLIEHSHQAHGSGLYFLKEAYSNIHIVCESCDDIADLDQATSKKVNKLIKNKTDFKEITNHFVYTGLCKKC